MKYCNTASWYLDWVVQIASAVQYPRSWSRELIGRKWYLDLITHCNLLTPHGHINLAYHWFRVLAAPGHCLKQCWFEIIGIHYCAIARKMCKTWWQSHHSNLCFEYFMRLQWVRCEFIYKYPDPKFHVWQLQDVAAFFDCHFYVLFNWCVIKAMHDIHTTSFLLHPTLASFIY